MSHLIAAIDESLRPNTYLLCATVASTSDRVQISHFLRSLLLPNQRRLHARTESEGRKRLLVKEIAAMTGITCCIATGPGRLEPGRTACLELLVPHVIQQGAREILIERPDHAASAIDKRLMQGLCGDLPEGSWRHEEPAYEPLLWISDVVMSAYGAGGYLRKLAGPIIAAVLSPGHKIEPGYPSVRTGAGF